VPFNERFAPEPPRTNSDLNQNSFQFSLFQTLLNQYLTEPAGAQTNAGLGRASNASLDEYVVPNHLNNPRFFDDVPVVPTGEQIDNSVVVVRYSDIISPINDRCPISLIQFVSHDEVMQIRHCGHVFCHNELEMWFQHNAKCPVCRYDIRDYVRRAFSEDEDPGELPDLELCEDDAHDRGIWSREGHTIWDRNT